jgi:hypothetical protein
MGLVEQTAKEEGWEQEEAVFFWSSLNSNILILRNSSFSDPR